MLKQTKNTICQQRCQCWIFRAVCVPLLLKYHERNQTPPRFLSNQRILQAFEMTYSIQTNYYGIPSAQYNNNTQPNVNARVYRQTFNVVSYTTVRYLFKHYEPS